MVRDYETRPDNSAALRRCRTPAPVALGQLAAGGALTTDQATALLAQTAASIGLTAREATRTIRSGLVAGARRPRSVAA